MEIQEGSVRYKDVEIQAIRGPQAGIFCAVWSHMPRKKKSKRGNEIYDHTFAGMIGCGVSGFNDASKWIGVSRDTVKWFRNRLTEKKRVTERWPYTSVDANGKCVKSVETHTFDTYTWSSIPEEFRVLASKLSAGLRFNQGDAYFANKLGKTVPATKPGKATKPMLTKILETSD
jgi:hypothetical protein